MQIILIVCFVAAVLELDNTSVGQLGFSRPLVCGTIFGYLTGNIVIGLQLGIFLELLFLDYTPVGGILPPNGTVAALCAVMASFYGAQPYMSFFFGVVMGLFYRFIEMQLRVLTGKILMNKNTAIANNPLATVQFMVWGSIAMEFLVNFSVMVLAIYGAKSIIEYGLPVNQSLHLAFQAAYLAVPWMGLFVMFKKFSFMGTR